MAEYIEREAVCAHCGAREINACSDECEVFNAPAADVVEVKRGEWRTVKLNRDKGTVLVECSECGCVFDLTLFAYGLNYNFCPNCGCLMGGD